MLTSKNHTKHTNKDDMNYQYSFNYVFITSDKKNQWINQYIYIENSSKNLEKKKKGSIN